MDKKDFRVIKGEIMWASLSKPNSYSGDYQVEFTNLSNAAVTALEELGIEAMSNPEKPEKGLFIRCKSKYPIRALDISGEVLDCPVGNGSKGKAVIGAYSWTFKGKKGVSPSLKKLVITDLVEYSEGEDEFSSMIEEEEAL